MKVLQFAFDTDGDNEYLPHNYERNYIVYTGTHDNQTLCGWYESIDDSIKEVFNTYINNTNESEARWDLICLAMRSIADTCIIPVQDYLGLGNEARINTPSTLGNNWKWRMCEGSFSKDITSKIKMLTKLYGRK